MTLAAVHFRQADVDGRQLSLTVAAIGTDGPGERLIFQRPGFDPIALRAAVLDAFEAVYTRAAAAPGGPMPLYVTEAGTRGELEGVAASFPAVTLVRTPRGRLPELLCDASDTLSAYVSGLRPPAEPVSLQRVWDQPELTVATDASKSSSRRGVGVACISEEGDLRQKMYPEVKTVLAGELLAIKHALKRFPHRDLHILTDSRGALGCLTLPRAALLDRYDGEVVTTVARIRELSARRRVRYTWVRAHSGHPLNEAADRLAVAARRNHEFGVDPATRAAIADNIVAPLLARTAA
ncbi:ribonuclease H family protein [Rhodococcus sp. NPDC127528]|uniref:ribonuclease H family protein n=1 Tax=unclassified Rhodococcus (in: high G+C Gram-positive bacteria) TaxID=192944 RepID=UPI00363F2194